MANIDDIKWLRYAYKVAAEQSTDPSTQNGACLVDMTIVPGGFLMVESANHFPRGVAESPERWERDQKYFFVEHAERNVLYSAAACGVKTKGLTMYVPWFACFDCARAIIQTGIAEVVGHKATQERTPPRWKDSIRLALGMLDEAQVPYRLVDCEIGDREIRFDGKLWRP